jgi:L-glyceraldehyde 3-phosphate reductase
MQYNRCGKSGLLLPKLSLGLWHNFGEVDSESNFKKIIFRSFDLGITHFDLANNYGPPPGSAEENFGKILKNHLSNYRDELIISTKAGYYMWQGPYGDWGSRKYLMASLNQSLRRMNVEYVDIFYHHRPDPLTPLEETMKALADIVAQGKALYVGLSNYKPEQTIQAVKLLKQMGTPCLIHQAKYSMFERWVEPQLLEMLDQEGVGCIAFSPLAQGLLTDKYLKGIAADSRAGKSQTFLKPEAITKEKLAAIGQLNIIAKERGQTLAQMALQWVMRNKEMTSVLIGASKPEQVQDAVQFMNGKDFDSDELKQIDSILNF